MGYFAHTRSRTHSNANLDLNPRLLLFFPVANKKNHSWSQSTAPFIRTWSRKMASATVYLMKTENALRLNASPPICSEPLITLTMHKIPLSGFLLIMIIYLIMTLISTKTKKKNNLNKRRMGD